MTIDQISVFVENRPGRLAEVTEILSDAGIDLRAMSIADTADFGILRLIVDDPKRALDCLRAAACVVSVTQVLAAPIADEPGSLSRVLRLLADGGVNIEYLYAFITRQKHGAYVILRVEDNARAADILTEHGVRIAGSSEIFTL
ncbi:MAG: ACT domain-containing protein [Deltaproteobacteria bacterium]|jgi:hypothetical protein|nr:ACT domain-containing protein [Deltaproteobacteria bacterium]